MRAFFVAIGLLAVIALLSGAMWFVGFRSPAPNAPAAAGQEEFYVFDDAGLSFKYPKTYTFESYPLQDDTASWISLKLVRTRDKEAAEVNGASEGPVAITIGIFDNPANQSVDDWIRNDTHSNFDLSADQKLTPLAIGNEQGESYEHSGLFENDAVAVARGGKIYLFEVSWADAGDSIRTDFQNFLKTVQFK